MALITLDEVKTYTGISDTAQDAAITAMLPIIDAKVKAICNNRFNSYFTGNTDSSEYVELYDFEGETLEPGSKVSGQGIDSDTYIEEVFYHAPPIEVGSKSYSCPLVKLNKNTTASKNGAQIFIGINIGYLPTIAKGVLWLINGQTTSSPSNSISSKSMGPVSIQYSQEDQRIDNRYGMPGWFVKALPRYHGGF